MQKKGRRNVEKTYKKRIRKVLQKKCRLKVEEAGEQQTEQSGINNTGRKKTTKEKARPKVCPEWFEPKNKIKEEKKWRDGVQKT